jgi:hypothetical protein
VSYQLRQGLDSFHDCLFDELRRELLVPLKCARTDIPRSTFPVLGEAIPCFLLVTAHVVLWASQAGRAIQLSDVQFGSSRIIEPAQF